MKGSDFWFSGFAEFGENDAANREKTRSYTFVPSRAQILLHRVELRANARLDRDS